MIILSAVLVVLAFVLLAVGVVFGITGTEVLGADEMRLTYVSIGVSAVSGLCLAVGVFLRRKELFDKPASDSGKARKDKTDKARKDGKDGKDTGTALQPAVKTGGGARPAAGEAAVEDAFTMSAQPADVPDEALVYVVRGRKRYHLDNCRQLMGREKEELTYAEAREEGFSPCTACLPDAALAARAAAEAGTATAEVVSGLGKVATPAKGYWEVPAPAAAGAAATGGGGMAFDEPGDADRPGAATGERIATDEREPESAEADMEAAMDRPAEPAKAEPASIWLPPERGARKTGRPGQDSADVAAEHETSGRAEDVDDDVRSRADAPKSTDAARTAEFDAVEPAAEPEPVAEEQAVPEPRDPWTADLAEDEDTQRGADDADSAEAGGRSDAEPKAADDGGPQVRILSGTKRYHRASCALIVDIGDDADDLEALPRSEATARGCTPCLVCEPDKEHARD